MKTIICDTNIWYRIGDKGIHPIKKYMGNDIKLCISHLSYLEIISSNSINKNFEAFKWANNAVNKYATVLVANDMEQVLLALNVKFVPVNNLQVVENIQRVCKSILDATKPDELNYEYDNLIHARSNASKHAIEDYQKLADRLNKRKNVTLEKIKSRLVWKLMKEVLRYVVKHNLKIRRRWYHIFCYQKYISTFNLYFTCLANYLYAYIISKRTARGEPMKLKSNDYVDFRNLLYCTKNEKYLTLDKSTDNRIGGMLRRYGASYELECAEKIKNEYK